MSKEASGRNLNKEEMASELHYRFGWKIGDPEPEIENINDLADFYDLVREIDDESFVSFWDIDNPLNKNDKIIPASDLSPDYFKRFLAATGYTDLMPHIETPAEYKPGILYLPNGDKIKQDSNLGKE